MMVFHIININHHKILQPMYKYNVYLRNMLDRFMNKTEKYSILIKGNRPKMTTDKNFKVIIGSMTVTKTNSSPDISRYMML